MQNYNVIKKIGKGSFSNVYLCNYKNKKTESLLFLSGIYNDDDDFDDIDNSFIIKEINTNSLVRKYMNKAKISIRKYINHKKVSSSGSVCITPYSEGLKVALVKLESEEDYYYKRLKNLIESEIEILRRLSHVNIIKYIDSSKSNNIYSIKMEYCQYGDLHTILKDISNNSNFKLRNSFGGFNSRFIHTYLIDTASGLKYMHNLNIIHRDIKLQNILVKKTNENFFLFKISDFGFSCFDNTTLRESLQSSDIEFSSSALKKKYYKLCGTPYYMAPEIITNMEKFDHLIDNEDNITNQTINIYDKKVDLWSYGICLYELIFNTLPFCNNALQDIHDFKDFFLNELTQNKIYNVIITKKIIDDNLKYILKGLLCINPINRLSTESLYTFLQSRSELIINESGIPLEVITNESPNTFTPNIESWVVEEKVNSWDKINKASSMILKVSVDNNFMEWLLKKNINN